MKLTVAVFGLAVVLASAAGNAGGQETMITPGDLTLDKLKAILEKTGATVNMDGRGLRFDDKKGHNVRVNFDPEKKLVSFVLWFNFRAMTSRGNRMKLVNDINREVIVTRAALDDQDDLRFDYWFTFADGITEKQIFANLKLFLNSSDAALRLQDTVNLVK